MSRRSSRRVPPISSTARSQASSFLIGKGGSGADAPSGVNASAHAWRSVGVEQLENRTLFSTIGVAGAALDGGEDSGVVEFQQGSPAITFRVAYHDVLAELIGVAVDSNDNVLPAGDLVPATASPPTVVPNLFKIYIAASDLTSYLVIAEVPSITTVGPRPMDPFGGSAGTLKVLNASTVGTQPTVTIPTTGGSMLIGNVHDGTLDSGVPIYQTNATGAIGVYPGSNGGPLEAGIEMAATNDLDGVATPNDIGKILIGGTILGSVNFPAAPAGTAALGQSQGGNVGLFYAGEILTGDADGIFDGFATPADTQTANFVVGGDLRDLYTFASIGGDDGASTPNAPQYMTGFYATIAGKVSDVYQNSEGLIGTFDVQHDASIYGLPESLYPETEVEYQNQANAVGDVFQGLVSGTPQLPAPFTNDSINTPQYLSSISQASTVNGALITDASGNVQYSAYVSGTLQGTIPDPETDDNYAVPVLAGQTITITLTSDFLADVLLYDPQGRLVASDLNNTSFELNGQNTFFSSSQTADQPFSYTPDRPGEYTIDVEFTGSGQNVPAAEDDPYSLEVNGIGNLGLGTWRAATNIFDGGYDNGFEVDQGDLGALIAGGTLLTGTSEGVAATATVPPVPATTVDVGNGNLRELKAGDIGQLDTTTNTFGGGPYLLVPNGAVGLIEATDDTGILDLYTNYDPYNLYGNGLSGTGTTPIYGANGYDVGSPVGGNFQEIDGAGTVYLDIATNQGIGNILAGNMATNIPSFIDVNQDNAGDDGIVDLIDCAGDFGTLSVGGPAILTHTGGDVRYIAVGGAVYEDHFFSSGGGPQAIYAVGQTATITDDSGSTLSFTPTGAETTATIANADGTTSTLTTGPQLTLVTYGIRGTGGVVVISVVSTGGLDVTSGGTLGSNSQAEIGSITITGLATAVALNLNATTGATTNDNNGEATYADSTNTATQSADSNGNAVTDPLFGLVISGPASTDVLRVTVDPVTGETTANANMIENLTQGGEIGGISAGSVGTILSYGTLGLLKNYTGAALQPFNDFFSDATSPGNAYPFDDQTFGIVVLNNVYAIEAYQGLGNIYINGGVQQITANANGRITGTGFEGINGPIVAVIDSTIPESGRILNVSIGQGILPSGSGAVGFSGIFAENDIGTVTNNNVEGADIRGDIVSQTAIDNISLGNGSIIGATIAQLQEYGEVSLFGGGRVVVSGNGPVSAPTYAIKNVSINGNGGIIGADFIGSAFDNISVGSKGFGILYTAFGTAGNGVINNISAGGYGIRDSVIDSGTQLNSFSATGNGKELSVASFGSELRQSETSDVDAYFGTAPTPLTDLDAALGTSITTPILAGVTDTGVLEDDIVQGQGSLGTVSAQTIRTAQSLITQSNPLNPTIPVLNEVFPMSLNFAGNTGAVLVRGIIDGLQITTGTLGRFIPGGSVSRCGIAVSGAINKLVIHGNYGQTFTSPVSGLTVPDSYIDALGVNGTIGSLKVFGSLNGNVTANSHIGSIIITGNVVGSITINGQTNGLALNTLRIGGTLSGGSLVIDGSANSITTSGSLGSLGDSLTITGSLKSLTVGANHSLKGSDLALNLNVQGGLGKLTVFGRIDGAVTVAGNLGKLQVINDGTSSNAISGAMNVGGSIGTAKVINGSVNADITANNDIGNFTIQKGSLLAGDVITSRIGNLKKFVETGAFYGSIQAPDSLNGSILISGAFGDGTDPASILVDSASLIRITGAMAAGTTITATSTLQSIEVDGGLDATATITGHPIVKQKIGGTNAGTINAS